MGVCFQSCWTLCDPVDCSPPGSSVHGISEARITRAGYHFLLQGIFPTQVLNHVSQVPCIAGGCFTAEPSGKPRDVMGARGTEERNRETAGWQEGSGWGLWRKRPWPSWPAD